HFVAQPGLARGIAEQEGDRINTDDRNLVEFGFAHSIGSDTRFDLSHVRALARLRKEDRPPIQGLDFARVEDGRAAILADAGGSSPMVAGAGPRGRRATALFTYAQADLRTAGAEWNAQPLAPSRPDEITMLAEALAETGAD